MDGSDDSGETLSPLDNASASALEFVGHSVVSESPLSGAAVLVKTDAEITDAGVDIDDQSTEADEDEEALRQSIQGLYALWRLNRVRKGLAVDKEVFVRIVGDAIGI